MDAGDAEALLLEEVLDADGLLLVQAEDENAIVLAFPLLRLLEELEQPVLLIPRIDHLDRLGDARVGLELYSAIGVSAGVAIPAGSRPAADGDLTGSFMKPSARSRTLVGQVAVNMSVCLAPPLGALAEDELDVVFEALVQHAIGLIEDDKGGLGEREGAVGEEVLEASWRGHDDVRTAVMVPPLLRLPKQQLALVVFAGPAIDANRRQARGGGQRADGGVRLHGELSRRRHDDGHGVGHMGLLLLRPVPRARSQRLDTRQRKGERLARPRLGPRRSRRALIAGRATKLTGSALGAAKPANGLWSSSGDGGSWSKSRIGRRSAAAVVEAAKSVMVICLSARKLWISASGTAASDSVCRYAQCG